MKKSPAAILGFESVMDSLRETEQLIKVLNKSQEENARLIKKNAKLIEKLGRQKNPDAQYTVRQLATMCHF